MTFDSSKKSNRAWREWAFFIFLMFFEFFCFFSVFPSPLYFCCVVSIFDAFPLIFFALGVGKCSLFLRCLPISSATILIFRSPLYFISSVSCVSFLWFHSIFPCAWHEWVFSIWVSIFHFSRCFYVCSVCFCLNTLNFSCVLPIFLDLVIIILVRGVNEYFLSLLIFTNMFCFCSIFPHSTLFLLTRGVSEYSLSFLTFTHFFCICSTFSEASLFCLRLF